MSVVIALGHPAHFHLFKNTIADLRRDGVMVRLITRSKDVLEKLLDEAGWQYVSIDAAERPKSRVSLAFRMLARVRDVTRYVREWKPDVLVGTSVEIAVVGKLLGIPSLVVNEDDWDAVPLFAWAAYPWATFVVAPSSCRMGRWEHKAVHYEGYHELAYLHPARFSPDERIGDRLRNGSDRYFILRFAELTAHHDRGKRGLSESLAGQLIDLLAPKGRVYITSERAVGSSLQEFLYPLSPSTMHDALFSADLYVGDSQTMAAEAAVLGTPSVRYNDFVGRIGYLDELEHEYGLTKGFRTGNSDALLSYVRALTADESTRDRWRTKRERMLDEKIDVATYLTGLIKQFTSPKTGRST